MISGDNDFGKHNLKKYFKNNNCLLFNQTHDDKLDYIKMLQGKGRKILMVGDGLNDAGALKQCDVGISVSEDVTNFFPSCDAIIDASEFSKLGKLIKFSKTAMNVIKVSFTSLFLYNVIGLYLAAQGTLSIFIAAIIMPFISVLIIFFVIGATNFVAKREKLL